MKGLNKEQQKEYELFMNQQFLILKGHFENCFNRCINKLYFLENSGLNLIKEVKENGK